jgi:predicted small lipoprotein YifL
MVNTRKKLSALTLALSLMLTLAACGSEPEPEQAPDSRPTADLFNAVEVPAEIEIPDEPDDFDEPAIAVPPLPDGITWLAEPVFEYSWLFYCAGHDVFDSGGGDIVDEKTGQLTGEPHGVHSGGKYMWLYDEELDIFASFHQLSGGAEGTEWFLMSEFDLHFPNEADTIKAVCLVDSTNPLEGGGMVYHHEDAFFGTAIAVGNSFVTDFIYIDGGNGRQNIHSVITAVDSNNMHGIIGRDGGTVVPFVFDGLLLISGSTAFARLAGDDYWGIIEFGSTEPYINTALFDELFPFGEDYQRSMEVPISEIFVGIELPATVSDIVEAYNLLNSSSQWWGSVDSFIATFVCWDGFGRFDEYDRSISVYTLKTSEEIDVINNCYHSSGCQSTESYPDCGCEWIDLVPLLIFDEDSTVFVHANKKQFVDILWSTANWSDTVEELIENIMALDNVDSIRVFRSADDLNNGGEAIFEGAWQEGMCYEIIYDDGESSMQSMWRF